MTREVAFVFRFGFWKLRMFEKSLEGLVRGIRSNKKNESAYIGQCLAEIKEEIKSNDLQKKTVAVQKLTYVSRSSTSTHFSSSK